MWVLIKHDLRITVKQLQLQFEKYKYLRDKKPNQIKKTRLTYFYVLLEITIPENDSKPNEMKFIGP